MAISAYVGLQGHGKSYGVVANVIVPALKKGRTVFANIPMNNELCQELFGSQVIQYDIQDILDNPNWWSEVLTPGALIIIDECWRLWPSGMKAINVKEQDKTFLAEHRHIVGEDGKSTEIFLVTQCLSQLAIFVRNLVETTFRTVKHLALGADNRYRIDVYMGPVTGPNPPIKRRVKEIQGKFDPKIFELYQSHTKSETGEAGDETRTDQRLNIFKGYRFYSFVAVIVIGSFLAFAGLRDVFTPDQPKASSTVPVQPSQNLNAQVQSQPNAQPRRQPQAKASLTNSDIDLFSEAESITIAFNRGEYPNISFVFEATYSSGRATYSQEEIKRLGYNLKVINGCSVYIYGNSYANLVTCPKPVEPDPSLFGSDNLNFNFGEPDQTFKKEES